MTLPKLNSSKRERKSLSNQRNEEKTEKSEKDEKPEKTQDSFWRCFCFPQLLTLVQARDVANTILRMDISASA